MSAQQPHDTNRYKKIAKQTHRAIEKEREKTDENDERVESGPNQRNAQYNDFKLGTH